MKEMKSNLACETVVRNGYVALADVRRSDADFLSHQQILRNVYLKGFKRINFRGRFR